MINVRDCYDVIVVGAGPAGSIAARTVAQAGYSVLLVEKRQEIGSPVRCAEGISREGLEKFVEIDPKWICAQIDKYRFFSPNGTCISMKYSGIGYIIERKIFDRDLANMAAQAGAQVLAKTEARGLLFSDEGSIKGVILCVLGELEAAVKAKIVVGADGVESQVGRWAGIDTVPRLCDMHTTVQYLMTSIDVAEDTCDFYFGSSVAPGGYLWVFPKGNNAANVGLGVAGNRAEKSRAKTFLDLFVKAKFPTGSVLGVIVGGIPLSGTLKQVVKDGLMLVGDAAHQAFPHTGGGIQNAMEAGSLAGQVAVQALEANDFSNKFLSKYAMLWHHRFGKEMAKSYKIKEIVSKLDDESLNRGAALFAGLNPESVTMKKVLMTVFEEVSGLFFELGKLI